MTSNTSTINEHARKIAEQQGISAKALRKVAKELIMDSTKLQKRLDDELQLDMFRSAVGLIEAKGLAA